jgi:hypothetical protein
MVSRNDVIRMAREAGGIQPEPKVQPYFWKMHNGDLERFAALVAAAEREACAKVVEKTKWSNWFQADAAAAIRARSQS